MTAYLMGGEETKQPITTADGLDGHDPQPIRAGGRSLGCQGRAVAKAAAQRCGGPRCPFRARRRPPARAGAMVKLAAKCLLAGECGPHDPIRPAGYRGLERALWRGARPAARAARFPSAPP